MDLSKMEIEEWTTKQNSDNKNMELQYIYEFTKSNAKSTKSKQKIQKETKFENKNCSPELGLNQ